MFQIFEQARHFVTGQGIQVIDLKFCDMWGRWHHLTIPVSQFEPKLMEEGIGFDGSSVGLKSVKAGDMVLVPDLGTAFLDPFWETPTISFICRTLEADTHETFADDPRNIAIRAEEYMKSTGVADESRWGPEYEFYIFDSVSFENDVNHSGYTIECREADWNSNTGGHGHYIPLHGGYHAIPPKGQLYKLRTRITGHLEKMGVPVKYHHHEVGGPGQCEIETPMMGLVQAGDATMIIKYVTKMTAHENGQTVTFMPKPLFGEAGNVYLMLAAQLMAGLGGIKNRINPTEAGFGPIDANIFAWSDEQRAAIKPLPSSLNEALRALEADHDFLTQGEVFSEEMIRQWVDFKRHSEYYAVRNRPHPYEMSLYFDV